MWVFFWSRIQVCCPTNKKGTLPVIIGCTTTCISRASIVHQFNNFRSKCIWLVCAKQSWNMQESFTNKNYSQSEPRTDSGLFAWYRLKISFPWLKSMYGFQVPKYETWIIIIPRVSLEYFLIYVIINWNCCIYFTCFVTDSQQLSKTIGRCVTPNRSYSSVAAMRPFFLLPSNKHISTWLRTCDIFFLLTT